MVRHFAPVDAEVLDRRREPPVRPRPKADGARLCEVVAEHQPGEPLAGREAGVVGKAVHEEARLPRRMPREGQVNPVAVAVGARRAPHEVERLAAFRAHLERRPRHGQPRRQHDTVRRVKEVADVPVHVPAHPVHDGAGLAAQRRVQRVDAVRRALFGRRGRHGQHRPLQRLPGGRRQIRDRQVRDLDVLVPGVEGHVRERPERLRLHHDAASVDRDGEAVFREVECDSVGMRRRARRRGELRLLVHAERAQEQRPARRGEVEPEPRAVRPERRGVPRRVAARDSPVMARRAGT